jgi:O-antigen ligase
MQWQQQEWQLIKPLFFLIGVFCLWDLTLNIYFGNSLKESLIALRHVRKLFFVILLWPLFVIPKISRIALLALAAMVAFLAAANIYWTFVIHGVMMTSFMPNMHGQILVGMTLLSIHAAIHHPRWRWALLVLAAVLLTSLLLASTRRTGYVLLGAGSVLLLIFEWMRQPKQHRMKYFFAGLLLVTGLLLFAMLSPNVQSRMATMMTEYRQYFDATTEERSRMATSIGLRLQYVYSSWLIIQDHFWMGVGSLNFKPLFWQVNQALGATDPVIFAPNPHNEYAYMWATKGLIGLGLYLGIFIQACRIAAHRADAWQREGLWLFVFLFAISIAFNSMSIDMVEGHFMMLVLLTFLAPKQIWSDIPASKDGVH